MRVQCNNCTFFHPYPEQYEIVVHIAFTEYRLLHYTAHYLFFA